MWIVLVGGFMITLPATAVILFSFGRTSAIPALASLAINMLPFILAAIVMKKSGADHGHDLEH